ncbi:hypothetical protein [Flammeovirga sp. SJP92]|uniref:hypothetical protein n=1 Tax=Flammeovirga sp. SJP92 TaxID=1775430 RepID=UPI0007869AA4|nr:hypothetical protein [Flammeovirga sp. SJP92]KXX66833.1 hypothetical protein AVL50_30335 [Flammeovirga sp. SJP92]
MPNVKFKESEKVKNHLILKFEGVCGHGSMGNQDVDFIIEKSKEILLQDKSFQSILFDFRALRYTFGNRFSQLFIPHNFKNNKQVYIRLIPNEKDVEHWQSLIKECTSLSETMMIQKDIKSAIYSVNKQMNTKH